MWKLGHYSSRLRCFLNKWVIKSCNFGMFESTPARVPSFRAHFFGVERWHRPVRLPRTVFILVDPACFKQWTFSYHTVRQFTPNLLVNNKVFGQFIAWSVRVCAKLVFGNSIVWQNVLFVRTRWTDSDLLDCFSCVDLPVLLSNCFN